MTHGTNIQPAAVHLPNFPRLLTQLLLEDGFTAEEIFSGLGFDRQNLADEKFRLSTEQHRDFIQRALSLTGNPHLALHIYSRAFDVTYSAFLMTIANSGHISKALHLITRYNRVYTRTVTVRPVDAQTDAVLQVEAHVSGEAVTYFAVSSFVLFVDSFFREVLGGRHLVKRAEMGMPKPEGFDDISDQFGFEMSFGFARTLIFLDPDLMDTPLKQADPQTVRLMMEVCERQLQEAEAEDSITGAVTSLVLEHISSPPKLEQAASMLGLSARSLRRQLQNSGTTYQSILDGVRQQLAIRLLRETDEPVASIAYEIGFEHASHFGRAFKRWTGQSPSAYRKP